MGIYIYTVQVCGHELCQRLALCSSPVHIKALKPFQKCEGGGTMQKVEQNGVDFIRWRGSYELHL